MVFDFQFFMLAAWNICQMRKWRTGSETGFPQHVVIGLQLSDADGNWHVSWSFKKRTCDAPLSKGVYKKQGESHRFEVSILACGYAWIGFEIDSCSSWI